MLQTMCLETMCQCGVRCFQSVSQIGVALLRNTFSAMRAVALVPPSGTAPRWAIGSHQQQLLCATSPIVPLPSAPSLPHMRSVDGACGAGSRKTAATALTGSAHTMRRQAAGQHAVLAGRGRDAQLSLDAAGAHLRAVAGQPVGVGHRQRRHLHVHQRRGAALVHAALRCKAYVKNNERHCGVRPWQGISLLDRSVSCCQHRDPEQHAIGQRTIAKTGITKGCQGPRARDLCQCPPHRSRAARTSSSL